MRLSVLLAASICALSSLLLAQAPAVRPPIVREGVTVQVAPHTYVIPDGNVPQLPNVGIVVGSKATLVIDPGLGRRNGETVAREVAKVSHNTELFLASTHYHVEHTTGLVAFPPPAKYVNALVQEEDYERGAAAQARTFVGISPAHAALVEGYTKRAADITFDRDHTIDLGGIRVRMTVVGPTHTRGDTVLFVEGDEVLFAGDVVMNRSFVAANQNSSMKAWLAAFDRLELLQPRVIVPSHGPVGDGALIGTNRAFMQAIDTRVRVLKTQGRSMEEVAAAVQMEMQVRYPDFERVNGAAGAARGAYAEAP